MKKNNKNIIAKAEHTAFQDIYNMLIAVFISLFLLAAAAMVQKTVTDKASPKGEIMVEIFWPDTTYVDVDLWIQSPMDDPVGYIRKNGNNFFLLRDDLGQPAPNTNDVSGRQYEIAFSQGLVAGTYTINLVLFETRGHVGPVDVLVVVTEDGKPLYKRTLRLEEMKLQYTVVSFDVQPSYTGKMNINRDTFDETPVEFKLGSK